VLQYVLLGPAMAEACHDIRHIAGSAPGAAAPSPGGCRVERVKLGTMRSPGCRASMRWRPSGWAWASSCWPVSRLPAHGWSVWWWPP